MEQQNRTLLTTIENITNEMNIVKSTLETLEESRLCSICCKQERNMIWQCGHVCCEKCVNKVFSSSKTTKTEYHKGRKTIVKIASCPTCRLEHVKENIKKIFNS
jgi:hypothetical protein